MARVTVEDCIDKVSNRFDLVMLAAQRARQIAAGSPLTIDRDRDKNPVVALREIAGETVSIKELEESLIAEMQKYIPSDEVEEDLMELLAEEQEIAGQEQVEKEISEMSVEAQEVLEEAAEMEEAGGMTSPSEEELEADFAEEIANMDDLEELPEDIEE